MITRKDQTNALPILLRRTPYGVPTQEEFDKSAAKNGADWMPANWKGSTSIPRRDKQAPTIFRRPDRRLCRLTEWI